MEKTSAKVFLLIFIISSLVWLTASTRRTYDGGNLLNFGTTEFKNNIDPATERTTYNDIAEFSIVAFFSYPVVLISAIGYLRTTHRTFKEHGWLLMSAILLFVFIPVEVICFVRDWKVIELNYWGTWPLEEFRKAWISRITALAGLPLIATLCYFTIIVLAIWQPMKKKSDTAL
ncbi:MAG: hypothetical protein PHP42_11340 [Bacteroidota bacterium]|nr:hypothetical protein [Bacteroidota bacterium]